jgi:polysaccharide biosynthesis/export protein
MFEHKKKVGQSMFAAQQGSQVHAISRAARPITVTAVALLLSACAQSPGMKMSTPPALPVSGQEVRDAHPQESVTIPTTEVTMSLIEKMRQDSARDDDARIRTLFHPRRAYTVGAGDVLQITVWDHPELAAALGSQPAADARASDPPPGFVVDDNGYLRFPYAGRFSVAGLTIDEIQRQLADALGKSLHHPQVTVRIAAFRSEQIYVDGEVHTPGAQVLNDVPTTIYGAISHAGGFNPTADESRVTLVRGGKSYGIDFTDMLDRGLDPSRIRLQAGDVVRVAAREDHGVFVMGEVGKPLTALPLRSGKLTLSDALSQAGSINPNTADAAQLFVVRGTGKDVEVFHLNAGSPVSMILANGFELRPKDIVYVDNNSLVRFSRVLDLLTPAINAGLTAGLVAK